MNTRIAPSLVAATAQNSDTLPLGFTTVTVADASEITAIYLSGRISPTDVLPPNTRLEDFTIEGLVYYPASGANSVWGAQLFLYNIVYSGAVGLDVVYYSQQLKVRDSESLVMDYAPISCPGGFTATLTTDAPTLVPPAWGANLAIYYR